jgi:hypothetical protein
MAEVDAATGTVRVLDRDIPVPVEVRKAQSVAAVYRVDGDAVQAIVGEHGLTAARRDDGTGGISIAGVRYHDGDLGTYDELAIAYDVLDPTDPDAVVQLIAHLPVDGELTCAAGRGLWGFPKWVTDVRFLDDEDAVGIVLEDEGETVLSMRVPRTDALEMPDIEMPLVSLGAIEGKVQRTASTMRFGSAAMAIHPIELTLGERHPIARELRSLGLPDVAPELVTIVGASSSSWDLATDVTNA